MEGTLTRLRSAVPDLIAFALGLGVAWAMAWTTTDLVWSLWLSSLVVGYSMIVWSVAEPTLEFAGILWQHRAEAGASAEPTEWKKIIIGGAAVLLGELLVLAFFLAHFGGFHYVHAQFLISMFPLDGQTHSATLATFAEVARRYWWALPSAFLAERSAFLQRTFVAPEAPAGPPDLTPAGIAARKAANARRPPGRMAAPYYKVMRLHVLIIAFGAVHAAHLDSFPVYAVVYAVYFFPWRLFRPAVANAITAAT